MESDRRMEVRLKADQTTFLQVLNPLSADRMPVTILNTSESGMCVRTLTFLARGAQVRVFRKQLQVFGAVRYYTPADEGFRVGIQVASQQMALDN